MPISNDLAKQYEAKVKDIGNSFQGINPELVQAALSAGGSFGNTLGYSNPKELLGMTPVEFDNSMNTRAQLMQSNLQQLQGAVSIRDQLYGISKNRDAALQAARDEFLIGNENQRHKESTDIKTHP